MKKLILVILFLPSLASAQWSGVWVSGGGADNNGIHAAIVHNAIKLRGKFVTLIPPTDNQILKFDSASDSLKFEADVTGASSATSADSAATAHGKEDFDKLFPTSFLEFVIDTIGVRTAGSNLIVLARAQGDVLLQDSTTITGILDIVGSIGIGTSVPDAKLTITVGTTSSDTLLAIYGDLDTDNMTQADSLGIVVLQDGSVGIGTFDIIHTLEVAGHVGIDRTATANDQHALEITADAAGFGDFKVIDVIYTSGTLSAGEDEAIVLVNIDEIQASGGDITATHWPLSLVHRKFVVRRHLN